MTDPSCTVCTDVLENASNKVVCCKCFNFVCKTCYHSLVSPTGSELKSCPTCREIYDSVVTNNEDTIEMIRLREIRLRIEKERKAKVERQKELERLLMTPRLPKTTTKKFVPILKVNAVGDTV